MVHDCDDVELLYNHIPEVLASDDYDLKMRLLKVLLSAMRLKGSGIMTAEYRELLEPATKARWKEVVMTLSRDADPRVRAKFASMREISQAMHQEYLNDPSPEVRMAALDNTKYSIDFEIFRTAVLSPDLESSCKKRLTRYSQYVAQDYETFKALWDCAMDNDPSWENYLDFIAALRLTEIGEGNLPPEAFALAEKEILASPEYIRMVYAHPRGCLWWAKPEILDAMKDDPYDEVILALSCNPKAWVSTHEYLAEQHKDNPVVLANIAKVTSSNELLNNILHGTEDPDICQAVVANPAFSPLI